MSTHSQIGTLEIENTLWQFLAHIHKVDLYERGEVVKEFAVKVEQVKSDRYLTERQVAQMWPGLFSRRWLQEARRLRKGPAYGVLHRKIIYRKSDIEDYIETQLVSRQPTTG